MTDSLSNARDVSLARIVTWSASRRWLPALFACLAVTIAACSRDDRPPNARAATNRVRTADSTGSEDGAIDLGGPSYTPEKLTAVGSITGTIKLDGAPPPDTISITSDQSVCGTTADNPVEATPKGLSNVVVWIADVRTGKPYPVDKRLELSSAKCALDPRVQAAVVGSAVDVFNDDKLLHRLVFTRAGTHDTLTVMPFFNVGQVVADDRIAKAPGVVEVRCAFHPWTRGYIVVFDHPYFDVTGSNGSFTIDSLPPGRYTMMAWHEGADQPVARQVQVAAGSAATVDLAIKIAGAR